MSFALYLLYLVLTYLRPIEVFAPELAEYRPMLILSLLTLFCSFIASRRSQKIAASRLDLKLLAAFVFSLATSHIFNGWFGGAFPSIMDFLISAFLFLTTVMNVTSLKRLKIACAVVAFSTVTLGLAGIFAYQTGFMVEKLVLRQNLDFDEDTASEADPTDIPALETSARYLWRVRSVGVLSDPNDFGQALVVALPMLAGLYIKRRFFRNLIIIGLPAAVVFYTINLTHSRGALLGVGSLLFFGIRNFLGTVKTGILMGVGIVGALAVNMTGGRAYTANEESAGGRIDAWSEGLQMLRQHPIFGVGQGRFTDYHSYTAHNSFVLCFSELGMFGYFFWLGMIIVTYKGLTRNIELLPADSEERFWALLMRSALLGFFTCALFLSRVYEPPLYILLSLCMATIYCGQQSIAGSKVPQLKEPIIWRKHTFLFEVLSIIVIFVVVVVKNATVGKSL
ncbi:MAG: hypothetical protein EOP36_03275 [Rubrivivax sp.]|nr:MAG: hypothetical protein EOP36_03275 [Rubrivivax sp.]